MKISTKTKEIKPEKITPKLMTDKVNLYHELKNQELLIKKEMKIIETFLKSTDYTEITTDNTIMEIKVYQGADTFDLRKFKEDYPKLKWNDPKYFTTPAPIKKILLKKTA